ncbi:MAG TPA: ATP-grasp domain-containing protein [Thermoanaerobaculia bacterium]|nr:ATP-grasp domain-containing protein [Thermoanaerobaculia bacterium]
MPRVLLLLPTTTYRSADFLAAARRLGVEVTVGTEEPSAAQGMAGDGLATIEFRDPETAARTAVRLAGKTPFDAVIGVDDETEVAAAEIARALGLRHNSRPSAEAARHKPSMRGALESAGVRVPRFAVFPADHDPVGVALAVSYPCVLKPTFLAASRGVIRANDPEELVEAWARIGAILRDPDVIRRGGRYAGEILVEEFVPGPEVALEGLLESGALRVLAIFDKPDALDGPFFEETIYVTPSRLPAELQREVESAAASAARALGLTEGPVHVELRASPSGVFVIEAAARSIGGLCSRTLRFGTGLSLEELILRRALGMPAEAARESPAAGVMMIPIPRAGTLARVEGLEDARAVPGIVEATITIRPGQELVPLPEGWRYLGFLFSRAETPEDAERALREAHRKLTFEITSPQREGSYFPGE